MTNGNGESDTSTSNFNRTALILLALVAIAVVVVGALVSDLSTVASIVGGIAAISAVGIGLRSETSLRQSETSRRAEAAQSQKTIDDLAWLDADSGLYSFSFFKQALEHEISRSNRYDLSCTLLWLTLDQDYLESQSIHARNIDSSYLWRFISDLTRAAVRDTDTAAKRPGPFSIAVLLPQSDSAGGDIVMNRLTERLDQENILLPDDSKVSARFITRSVSYPTDGASAEELIRNISR